MDDFSLKPFQNALFSLELIVDEPKTDVIRDAVIQRFEYTFELAWKSLKRYFKLNSGLEIDDVKNILREAAKQGLIDELENWFGYHKSRNKTSHLYSIKVAESVYDDAKRFYLDARLLLQKLEAVMK